MRFSLDLQKQEVLEANTPGFGEPTHGTMVGATFYFIANQRLGMSTTIREKRRRELTR
jgi:hypothetical protein